jgi:hypothetical protein
VAKNHLREVGELLRRASITKDSNLCVQNCSEGYAKGILALYFIFYYFLLYTDMLPGAI